MKLSPYLHYPKINTKWNETQKALIIKNVIDKFYYIKMKNFSVQGTIFLKRKNRVEDICNPYQPQSKI